MSFREAIDRLLTPKDRRERMAAAEKEYEERPKSMTPIFEEHAKAVSEVDAAIERVLKAAARATASAKSVAPPRDPYESKPEF